MTPHNRWTRQQLLVAFDLYCRLPFGKIHRNNPEIVRHANAIGRTPSALAMRLVNIASIDPIITSSGRRGLSHGATTDVRNMWGEMHDNWDSFIVEAGQALEEFGIDVESEETSVDKEGKSPSGLGEDRTALTTVRRGQDFFRATVLSSYNSRCCITGLSIPKLLIASHIVPWRDDATNRVNPRNGLLLSALHDRAFDRGIITINDDFTVRVSKAYPADDFFSFSISAYDGIPIRQPEKFIPDQQFLAYHREHIFQG